MPSTNPFDPSASLPPASPSPVRDERPLEGWVRVGVALFATYVGLNTFAMALGYRAGRPRSFPLALLVAGVTVAAVFRVTEYAIRHRRAGVPAPVDPALPGTVEAFALTAAPIAAPPAAHRANPSGARTTFVTIVTVPAVIGGALCGIWVFFGPSGRSTDFGEAFGSMIIGGLVGGVLGVLIGFPAAALIWMTRRRP